MAHILRNKNLEIFIDLSNENYNSSRFDWTGKITEVKYRDIPVSVTEKADGQNENLFGRGFYNEFGIEKALGFDEAEIGGWFHKIGVGLLKKDDSQYLFSKSYQIEPAEFKTLCEPNRLLISCRPKVVNGYSYLLRKEITLHESGFTIQYYLENTGEKDIVTNEYVHNFTAMDRDLIGENYTLKFPFQLQPELFDETVNQEQKVDVTGYEIRFKGTPEEQFFFSNLSGSETVDAQWELINFEKGIGIRETGNFQTDKVNLWGWKHVISPELFFTIDLKPGQSTEWRRNYILFDN